MIFKSNYYSFIHFFINFNLILFNFEEITNKKSQELINKVNINY